MVILDQDCSSVWHISKKRRKLGFSCIQRRVFCVNKPTSSLCL